MYYSKPLLFQYHLIKEEKKEMKSIFSLKKQFVIFYLKYIVVTFFRTLYYKSSRLLFFLKIH